MNSLSPAPGRNLAEAASGRRGAGAEAVRDSDSVRGEPAVHVQSLAGRWLCGQTATGAGDGAAGAGKDRERDRGLG